MADVDSARRAAFAAFRAQTRVPKRSSTNKKSPRWIEEHTQPLIIRQLLSTAEVDAVFEAATMCGKTRCENTTRLAGFSARARAGLAEELTGLAYDIAYSDAHVRASPASTWHRSPFAVSVPSISRWQVALFMHRDGYFCREWPELSRKLVHTMRSQDGYWGDPDATLAIRCAEFHSYALTGGLTDANHRDTGSELTMSIMLSDETLIDGGLFTTFAAGQPVAHRLARGDAILFHSEKRHNVSTVTRGMRHTLVLELWQAEANVIDRYS